MRALITFSIIVLISFSILLSCKPALSQSGWTEENSGVTVQLNSVVITNPYKAWCCGNNGTVLKKGYILSGANWQNVSGNGIPSNATLVNIASPINSNDTSTALASGYIGTTTYVYRTTNAGASWTQVFSQANGSINAVWMWYNFALMQGNPVGGRWSLWKSTNNGLTWDSSGLYLAQSGSEHGWPNSLFSWNPNLFWFGTNNSRIYHSSNSGVNWVVQSTAPEQNSYALFLGSSGFAGGSILLQTMNSGSNWTQISSIGSGNFGGFNNRLPPYVWYIRSDNKVYMSSNSGSSWVIHYTAPAGNYRYMCDFQAFVKSFSMFAVRDNGGISKYVTFVRIIPISTEIPTSFVLYQNYPNPFNPATKIRFALPKSSFINLVVYDILGREVETIVNEHLNSGTYEVEWDASNYPSGIYFYKLKTSEYSDAKRMVLVK